MTISKVFGVLAAGVVSSAIGLSTVGAQSNAATFNIYNDVDGIGSEADFLRFGANGQGGNTIEACEDDQVLDLWFYVHNGAAASRNGDHFDGESVARNTTVDLDINGTSVVGTINASNAAAISNDVNVTCGEGDISLEYVGVSGFRTTAVTDAQLGEYRLHGSDLLNGVGIGYDGGVIPGCWEYRGIVTAQVRVVRAEEAPVATPVVETTPEVVETTSTPTVVETPVENVPEQVTVLPRTGPGSSIAMFAAVATVASLGYNKLARRSS